MSEIYYVYVKLPDYLAQWFVNDQGGRNPVKLIRGCTESQILEQFLVPTPKDMIPDVDHTDKLAIEIPNFKHKDPRSNNFLPPRAMEALIHCISNRFEIELWRDLHRFGYIGRRRKDIILAWMETHGIEDDGKNWDTIEKKYQRKRDIYLTNKRKIAWRKKSSK
jgi:hypothetical protein